MPAHSDRQIAAAIFCTALLAYSYLLGHPDQDHNANSRWDMVRAIVEDHSLIIDRFHHNTSDKAFVNGHFYSDKAPGSALLGVLVYAPIHALNQATGGVISEFAALNITRWFVVSIPSALLASLVFLACRRLGCSALWAALLALAFALGTPALPYATLYYSHQLSASLALLVVLLITPPTGSPPGWQPTTRTLVAAGLISALRIANEYQLSLVAVVCLVYLTYSLTPRSRVCWFALGLLPGVLGLALYNTAMFGSPWTFSYHLEATDAFQAEMSSGFASVTYPKPDALWYVSFSLARGLFSLSPFLILAFVGAWFTLQQKPRNPLLIIAILVGFGFIGFNAAIAAPHGGWTCGPRYALPGTPFLAILCAVPLGYGRSPWWKAIFAGLACVSIVKLVTVTVIDPHAPEVVANPLLDYWLPMGRLGYSSINPAFALGATGWLTAIPLLLILAAAIAAIVKISRRTSVSDTWSMPLRQGVAIAAAAGLLSFVPYAWIRQNDAYRAAFRADQCRRSGFRDAARAEYQAMLRFPQPTARYEAYRQLAYMQIEERQYNQALASMRDALAVAPEKLRPAAHAEMGHAYRHMGKLAESERWLRMARDFEPQLPQRRDDLGVVLLELGQWDEAESEFAAALQLDPKFAVSQQHLDQLLQLRRSATSAPAG
jgi:hypothetical protein